MEGSISTSSGTLRSLHAPPPASPPAPDAFPPQCTSSNAAAPNFSISLPSSPRSSALPSPPDSPASSAGSVSSFPSVSSSFFFSSAAASPPHSASAAHSELIIPSLTLPDALPRPTAYGQTLGELRVLVLGDTEEAEALVRDNEDVVEVGTWDSVVGESGARVLRASTDWIEHRDAHGLEKFEPTRNVEVVCVSAGEEPEEVVRMLKAVIHAPFHAIADVLHPAHQPSPVVANLVSSHSTPLFCALIMLVSTPSAPTPLERTVITSLHSHIPILLLPSSSSISSTSYPSSLSSTSPSPPFLRSNTEVPPTSSSAPPAFHRNTTQLPSISSAYLSSFAPRSISALRAGLFRTPESLALLRAEAGDRFLRWREVEREVAGVFESRAAKEDTLWAWNGHYQLDEHDEEEPHVKMQKKRKWDPARWEARWMGSLSIDVARGVRERERAGAIGKNHSGKKSSLGKQTQRHERERGGTITLRRRQSGAPPPPMAFVAPSQLPRDEAASSSSISTTSSASTSSSASSDESDSSLSYAPYLIPPSPHPNIPFDPLHLPSLLLYSLSLLGPLKRRVGEILGVYGDAVKSGEKAYYVSADTRMRGHEGKARVKVRVVGMALLGGFCLGVGVGVGAVLCVRRD